MLGEDVFIWGEAAYFPIIYSAISKKKTLDLETHGQLN